MAFDCLWVDVDVLEVVDEVVVEIFEVFVGGFRWF